MVLQVIGPLAGAAASAFGMSQQAKAQQLANAIQWRAVQEQARANRKQEQLQRATRTDAYGNAVEYVPGQGFVTRTTPITGSILNAEQKEALENLTVDAPRQREARRRQDRRSTQADGLFQDQFASFRYQRAPNQSENEAKALRDALMARNERQRANRGGGDTGQQLANMATRLGSSSAAQALARGLQGRDSALPTVSETISDARRLGRNDYQEDLRNRAAILAELDQIRGMADASPSVGINNTNLNESLTGRQEDAINQLSDVIGRGGQALAAQYNNAADMAFKSFPDTSGLAAALGRINFGSGQQQEDPNAAFQRTLATNAFNAGLRGMDSGQAMNVFRSVRGSF